MSSLSTIIAKKKKKSKKQQKISKKRKLKGQVQGTAYRFGFELFLIAGGTRPAPTGFFLRFRLQKILILQDC